MNIIKNILKQNVLLSNNNNSKLNGLSWVGTVVLPYSHGTTEELQRILSSHRIKTFYKITNTLRNALVQINDKIPITSTRHCVYRLGCVDCNAFYAGESSRELMTNNI